MNNRQTTHAGPWTSYSRHSNTRTSPVSATWVQNRKQEPAAPEDPGPAAARRAPKVGQRTELARYSTPAGERILFGQRVDGIVRITDRPQAPGGRAYLVERGLETKPELDALIADYLDQAAKLNEIPVAHCPLESYLQHIDQDAAE